MPAFKPVCCLNLVHLVLLEEIFTRVTGCFVWHDFQLYSVVFWIIIHSVGMWQPSRSGGCLRVILWLKASFTSSRWRNFWWISFLVGAGMQNQGGLASRQVLVTAAGSENFKPVFKEKFVSLYEDIFALRSPLQSAKDQGIQGRVAIGRFWDELLLLKVQWSYRLL